MNTSKTIPTTHTKISCLLSNNGYVYFPKLEQSEISIIDYSIGRLMTQAYNSPKLVFDLIIHSGGERRSEQEQFHPPHTDGAFRKDLKPDIISLYCIEREGHGGESLLIDCKPIIETIVKHSEFFEKLTDPFGYEINFKGRSITNSILHKFSDTKIAISYTPLVDRIAPKSQDHENALSYLRKLIDEASETSNKITLTTKSYLLIDNERMLHGRCDFKGYRHVQRRWYSK